MLPRVGSIHLVKAALLSNVTYTVHKQEVIQTMKQCEPRQRHPASNAISNHNSSVRQVFLLGQTH